MEETTEDIIKGQLMYLLYYLNISFDFRERPL